MRTCCRVCKVDHNDAAKAGRSPHLASCIHYIPDWRDQGRQRGFASTFMIAGMAVPFEAAECIDA